jgi:sugar porter (SP) family MFS transporter
MKNAFIYAAIVTIGGFVFGLDAALISGTIKFITTEFGLSDLQVGTVVSAPGFGVLFALPVASYLTDKFGRKSTLQLIAALYVVSAIGSAFAPSFELLVAARFLGGLAFTSLSLAAMYIGEIAPAHLRGKMVAMNQVNIVVGLSAAYFINYFLLQTLSSDAAWVTEYDLNKNIWRWMLGSEIIPAILWFVLLFFVPKSPRWLMLKGRVAEAKTVLAKLLPSDKVDEELAQINANLNTAGNEPKSLSSQIKILFSPKLRLALLIGLTFAIVQQITGINAILFYAPTVFEQIGGGTDTAFLQSVYVGIISVIFTVSALFFIDRVGRRPMTIWGLAWAVVSLLLCAYGFHSATYTLAADALSALPEALDVSKLQSLVGQEFGSDVAFKDALQQALGATDAKTFESDLLKSAGDLPSGLILFGILSFIASFQFSVGPIMWIVLSEIFSTKVRAVAIPVCAFVTSIVSWAVQKFFPWQLANMGARDIFIFYAVSTFIGLIILFKILPETKNKTIEEIGKELEG